MTDPAESRGRKNVSFDYLVSLIPATEDRLCAQVDRYLTRLKAKVRLFRSTRHRRIGHSDLLTRQRHVKAALPEISLQDMVIVLGIMARILNLIEHHFDENEKTYRIMFEPWGDGNHLLDFIARANFYRQYYEAKEYGPAAVIAEQRNGR